MMLIGTWLLLKSSLLSFCSESSVSGLSQTFIVSFESEARFVELQIC